MKYALIIGNSKYNDPKLAPLKTPEADSRELAKVLRAKNIGNFDEVSSLIDPTEAKSRRAISEFLSNKKPDDLVLLYFSGHGVLDGRGSLFLALKDTEIRSLNATAISSSFISYEMDNCRSRRQILILDCCNSGAFARGTKGEQKAITESTFEGSGFGRVVLTASDSTQFAFEGDQVIRLSNLSLFTHFLLEGLKTGEADLNSDGKVSLDEWYDYSHTKITAATPQQIPRKWSYNQQGDLIIAQNPFVKKKAGESLADPFREMLDQKQVDFRQHKLLLERRELEIIADQLEKQKLELREADKQLILLSAVACDNGQKWLAICGANGLDWLRKAYQDKSYPEEVRVGAAALLGELQDVPTYDHLLEAIQQEVQPDDRQNWLGLLVSYLNSSAGTHRLPWLVKRAIFPRLARLRIREGAQQRASMSRKAALAASLCVVVLFTAIFMQAGNVDLYSIFTLIMFAVLGAMMAFIFTQVITSLILIERLMPNLWQVPILIAAGSILGVMLFFMLTGSSELWFVGAFTGPVLALFNRQLANQPRFYAFALSTIMAVSVFVLILWVSKGDSLGEALSASLFTGIYIYLIRRTNETSI